MYRKGQKMGQNTLKITEARNHLSKYADVVALHGQRFYVVRNGNPAFVMVPFDDMRLLKAIENTIDIKGADEAIKRNKYTPWEQVKEKLGL